MAGWAVTPEVRLGSCAEKGAEKGVAESKGGRRPSTGRGEAGKRGQRDEKEKEKEKEGKEAAGGAARAIS